MITATELLPELTVQVRSLITFCIITNGARQAKTQREIDSIRAQGEAVEIVVAGIMPAGGLEDIDKFIAADFEARKGYLGAMRNAACEASTGDILVVSDDDMVFHPGFIDGIRQTPDFDALACRVLNTDGTRYWDWAICDPKRGQYLIDYTEKDDFTYITGGIGIYKRYVWHNVKWGQAIAFQAAEDVDFSTRIRAAGYCIAFTPLCTVTHNDSRYTQQGKWVVKFG